MAIRTLSLCTGGAGLELGLDLAFDGLFRPVCYCECEAYALETLIDKIKKGILPRAPVWDNVRTLRDADCRRVMGRVDAVIGGIPCQPHSVAGLQAGQRDPRDLWPPTRDFIGSTDTVQLVFIENVPGIFATGGARRMVEDLERMDFEVAAGLFTASEVGASHKRERFFVLAHRSCVGRGESVGAAAGGGQDVAERGEEVQAEHTRVGERPGDAGAVADAAARQRGSGGEAAGGDRRSGQPDDHSDRSDGDVAHANDAGQGARDEREQGHAAGDGRDRPPDGNTALEHAPRHGQHGLDGEAGRSGRRGVCEAGERVEPCEFCGYPFDHEALGRYGCPNCLGEGMADAGCEPDEGQCQARATTRATGRGGRTEVPLFPPGPGDLDAWRRILDVDETLAPASNPGRHGTLVAARRLYRLAASGVNRRARRKAAREAFEPAFRRMADGLAAGLDPVQRAMQDRTGRLRLCGNGVVALEAAYAATALAAVLFCGESLENE